jgi:hypothetical protein
MTWRLGLGPVTFRLQGLCFNPSDNLGLHYKTFFTPQLIPRRSKLLCLPPPSLSNICRQGYALKQTFSRDYTHVDNDKHSSLLRAVKSFTKRSPGFAQKPPILNRISCQIDQISVGQMSVGDSIGQTVFDQKSWNQPIYANFMTLNIWLSGAPL